MKNCVLLATVLFSLFFSAFATAFNGWGVCNLGIWVDDKPAASDAAIEKGEELWPQDNPEQYYWTFRWDSNWNDGRPTDYYWPLHGRQGALWEGGYHSHSWVACNVEACPNGYQQINGQCALQCGIGEVRDSSGTCVCPEGAVCADPELGPPGGSCSSGGGGFGGGGGVGASEGNPINVATGNKYQVETDVSLGKFLRIERIYNSQSNKSGPFGASWTWNIGGQILFSPRAEPATLAVHRPSGQVQYFERVSGAWVPRTPTLDTLTGWGRSGYQYKDRTAKTTEIYDGDGRLTRIQDSEGKGISFSYGFGPLYPEAITDDLGRSIILTYDSKQRISSITVPDGGAFSYGYDSAGNLVTVTNPDGSVRTYHYNEQALTNGANLPRALTGITDERGLRFSSWYYDSAGRAIASEKGQGKERTSLAFNSDGSTTVTNALGKQTTYHFERVNSLSRLVSVEGHASANCAASAKQYTYYPNGLLETTTDWDGNVTRFYYNERGLTETRIEAEGRPSQRITTIQWHPTFDLPVKVSNGGSVTSYVYDSSGKLITKTLGTN